MINPRTDPCDEMVSMSDIVSLVMDQWCTPYIHLDPYQTVSNILGVSRDEAKRRVYAFLYGGWL